MSRKTSWYVQGAILADSRKHRVAGRSLQWPAARTVQASDCAPRGTRWQVSSGTVEGRVQKRWQASEAVRLSAGASGREDAPEDRLSFCRALHVTATCPATANLKKA